MSNVFRDLAKQRPSEPERDSSRCFAQHCPCLGSVSMEGGRFVCSAHAFCASDQWPAITEKLHENRWLVAFIDDIASLDRNRVKDMPGWRQFATQFWTGIDAYCAPVDGEDALPYQNRMRAELLHRCGLVKRPAPRLPKPVKHRGNAADYVQRRQA